MSSHPEEPAVREGVPDRSQDSLTRSYDAVPYASRAFWYTHPDALATVATLAGMSPAPVDRCRVLELGCAGGGNLLPMAEDLPGSRFVGIDLSSVQIADGRRVAQALGLENLRLEAMSILDVPEDFGEFDYIIAHGVYSWVPANVQEKILEISRRHLAPQGVAYISYNTYPGWHFRQIVREMMLYHVGGIESPDEKAAQARALVQFLHDSAPQAASAYRAALADDLKRIDSAGSEYLLHEYLDVENTPLYFHEFVGRAAARNLQYLGEARQVAIALSPQVQEVLAPLSGDPVRVEQYIDFLRNRMFRWSLLVRDDVRLHTISPMEALGRLRVAAPLRTEASAAQIETAGQPVEFRSTDEEGENVLNSADPPIKRALLALGRAWPGMLGFGQLCAAAGGEQLSAETRDRLARLLVRAFLSGAVELHVHDFGIEAGLPDRPCAGRLARLCAASGLRVTNRRHHMLKLDDFERLVLGYLDGTRDRDALLEALAADVAADRISLRGPDGERPDPEEVRRFLSASLDRTLERFSSGAIWVPKGGPA